MRRGARGRCAAREHEGQDMLRLLKVLVVLAVIGFIGLAGFAYLGDLSPTVEQVTQPVTLSVD